MIKDKQKRQKIGTVKKQGILEEAVNYAYLSIGSNIGNRIFNLQRTKLLLFEKDINILLNSSYYETPSWPNPNFPKFINIVIKVSTKQDLKKFFLNLKKIERKMGKRCNIKNSPRICDIDIIDFNSKNFSIAVENQKLIVPHPRMNRRNFVLFPLFEIDKKWTHPKSKKNISELMSKLPVNSIRGIKVI